MSDVLGARIGSDDPAKITEVRALAPKILAVGAQPTVTPKQAPRLGAVYDDRGYLEGRDPETMSKKKATQLASTLSRGQHPLLGRFDRPCDLRPLAVAIWPPTVRCLLGGSGAVAPASPIPDGIVGKQQLQTREPGTSQLGAPITSRRRHRASGS